ncbi:MAG: hypothetical protein RR454_05390 [Clostridia bacterium]
MNLETITYKVRCDMPFCNHTAKFSIAKTGFRLKNNFNICEDCAKELYEALSKTIVPHSPENFIKKSNKMREV